VPACGGNSASPTAPPDAASADAAVDSWNPVAEGTADAAMWDQDATTGVTDAAGEIGPADDGGGPFDADAESEAAPTGDADAAGSCPDVRGQYGIQTSGSGCGSIFGSLPPCVRDGPIACDVVFQSSPAGGGDAGPSAIHGEVQLQPDGSFDNANLTVGTIPRMQCTGAWDPASSTMTVTCGGLDASEGCVLRLKRYASTCN
jgi:hypothetical protein